MALVLLQCTLYKLITTANTYTYTKCIIFHKLLFTLLKKYNNS